MTPLATDLLLLLHRDLHGFIREIEAFPDEQTLWRTLPGVHNSAGNLALHVAGNLQHFVGAVLGRTGYQRQRELEFSRREGTCAELTATLAATLEAVAAGLERLTPQTLGAPYPLPIGGQVLPTQRFLLHLSAHLAFHLGQVGYLRRLLTGEATSLGSMGLGDLAG